jgi:hypothetical protein
VSSILLVSSIAISSLWKFHFKNCKNSTSKTSQTFLIRRVHPTAIRSFIIAMDGYGFSMAHWAHWVRWFSDLPIIKWWNSPWHSMAPTRSRVPRLYGSRQARGASTRSLAWRGRDGTGNPPSNLTATVGNYVGLLLVYFPWVLVQKLKVKSECSFLEQLGKKKGNIILPANSFWPHFEQVLNSFEQVWVWTGTPTVHQTVAFSGWVWTGLNDLERIFLGP